MDGVLFMNGKKLCSGSISSFDYVPHYDYDDEIVASLSECKEFTFETHIRPQDILTLITGKNVSNNYFRTHGGIMRRKIK